jgi:hypothetical protein
VESNGTASEEVEAKPPTVVADAERTQEERFKWREYVHMGIGADECEHREDGKCTDTGHFHALCRLPTPFQIRDIQEKSQAAKARRLRQLRDPDSDARVILEDELDGLKEVDKELLADELLDRDFAEAYRDAVKEVDDIEDPDHVPEGDEPIRKLYANIDQDREEYLRQRDLPDEQRGDDFEELERVYAAYSKAIEDAMDRIQAPRREHFMGLELEELIDQIRRQRIEAQGYEMHLHTFNMWQMYVCTYKPVAKGVPSERVWRSLEEMKYNEDGAVIIAVRQTFERLEQTLARTRLGKGS